MLSSINYSNHNFMFQIDTSADNDPSKELEKEINALKDDWKNYFQAVETGVKNIYFIQCNKGDPYELTTSIFNDLIQRKASVR